MLRQSKDCGIPVPSQEKYRSSFSALIDLGLAIVVNGIEIIVLILTTFCGKVVTFLRFLPFLSFFLDTLHLGYHLYKLLLKPISWTKKIALGLTNLTAYSLNTLPSLVLSLLTVFDIAAWSWLVTAAPILMTASLLFATVLNTAGLADCAYNYIMKPWTQTEETLLRLANRSIKTIALVAMTAVSLPFFMAMGGVLITASLVNPFTAGPVAATLFSILLVASTVLLVMKIAKTIAQRRLQEKQAVAASKKSFTPYQILGLDEQQLNTLNQKERKERVTQSYQHNEAAILNNGQCKEEQSKELKENYLAYELLRSERTTALYQLCEHIKRGNNNQPLPSPEQQLQMTNGIRRFPPFSWCHYLLQTLFAKKEEKRDLKIAYKIWTHGTLYDYWQTSKTMLAREKQTLNVASGSYSTILRSLSWDGNHKNASLEPPILSDTPCVIRPLPCSEPPSAERSERSRIKRLSI